jgi:DNA-binding IscR family transcriptional regulator
MSILLMSRVFATNLSPSKKIVLLALADFANDEGKNIFPSVATIAKKSSLSHRSVQTILGGFVGSGILHITRNPSGGAPGMTRHLEIDLVELNNLMGLARDENFAPVQMRGENQSHEGVQADEKTGETPAPEPSNNHHKTTTDEHSDTSRGGGPYDFDWPPQLDSDEREAIQTFFLNASNSHQQKQFALDELRAALASREIPRKASWVRAVLARGIERTPAGKAYERSRKEKSERAPPQRHKTSEPKTEAQKNSDRERIRKIKESLIADSQLRELH